MAEHGNGQGTSSAVHVDVVGLRHRFGNQVIFDGLDCTFGQGELTCILGASGVGKSTLLRMLASLQNPQRGDIWAGNQHITSFQGREASRYRRRVGMMFQGGALLDSMSVFENAALPLREQRQLDDAEIEQRVHEQFRAVGLEIADHLLPAQISGGMKKRLALARAMITEPEILLCDEPFSGLDPIAVRMVETLLIETKKRTGITMILTNHHIGSTMRMADKIVFLISGGAVSGSVASFRSSSDPRIIAFLDAASARATDDGARGGHID